jgi:hypothetical protein
LRIVKQRQKKEKTNMNELQREQTIKFPSEILENAYLKENHLSRTFYVVYTMLLQKQSIDGCSFITLGMVADFYGATKAYRKPKCCQNAIECLKFMQSNGMICTEADLYKASYNTAILVELGEFMLHPTRYFEITISQLLIISKDSFDIGREYILLTFLYVMCHRYVRTKSENEAPSKHLPTIRPEVYYGNIEKAIAFLKMGSVNFRKALRELCTLHEHPALLKVKRPKVKFVPGMDGYLSNIYAVNNNEADGELSIGYERMLQYHRIGIDSETGEFYLKRKKSKTDSE